MEWRIWGKCHDVKRTVAMLLLALALSLFGQAVPFVSAVAPDVSLAAPSTDNPTSATPAPPLMAMPANSATSATPVARPGIPVRMRIPKIGVDAAIQLVGLAADGAMDTPKNFADTAWYQLGPRPGEQGNAVIAGHVDSTTGVAVFWDLRKLNQGDEIFVMGDDGAERRFVVGGWETYEDTVAPLTRIFGPSTSPHLNLITCDSNSRFERSYASYSGALVLYADAAP